MLTLALLLGLWGLNARRLRHEHEVHHREATDQAARRVQDYLRAAMVHANVVRRHLRGPPVDIARWRAEIAVLVDEVVGIQALNVVSVDGRISLVVPTEGNEAALGRDLSRHPDAGPALRAAFADDAFHATAPLDLYQGGRGFTAYGAIRDDAGELQGAINVVFRIDELASAALDHLERDPEEPERALWIVDRTSDELVWGAPPASVAGPTFDAAIQVADRAWELRTAEDDGLPPFAHALALVLALLGASLVAGVSGLRARLRTRVRREEVERARIAERLRESERLESIGRLAGGVAHDFNNVLTIITGSAEILADDLDEVSELRDEVAAILDAAERGSLLTRQLLTFAKREPVQGGTVDLVAHLQSLAPMLRHAAGRKVAFTLTLPTTPVTVAFSAASVDRVALNLVTNAGEAMGHAGAITLSVEVADGCAVLRVVDDGPGMSPEVRARIFEPFFTTRSEGTGLGLATVYGLVEAASGRIDVDTREGQGTTFEVRLPLAHPTGAFAAIPEASALRLLVVDDEVLVRRVIQRALSRRGYEVDQAQDGVEALARLEELAATGSLPAALVTDVRMPNMDGLTLVKHVRGRWPELPVLMVSGFTDGAAETATLLGETVRFLDKPFESAQLVAHVAELIELARSAQADTPAD